MVYFIALFIMGCTTQKAENNMGADMEELIQKGGNILIKGKTFESELDFCSLLEKHLIGNSLFNIPVQSSITFQNCVFKGPVKAYNNDDADETIQTTFHNNLSFLSCKFESEVNLRSATIYGRTDFSGSEFFGPVNFEESSFYQNAYFNKCKFGKELRFQNSFFHQKANFMNAEFEELVSFQSAVFNGETQFSVAKFFAYADMTLLDCRTSIFFTYAEFLKKADFGNARFVGDANFISSLHVNSSYENCRFMGKCKFFKSTVDVLLKLDGSFFLMGKPELGFLDAEKVSLD